MPLTQKDLEGLARGIAPAIVETIKRSLAPVKERITALEQRPALKYCGAHQPNTLYREGSFTSRGGGLWLAVRDTASKPGSDDSGWRLVCKEGRAG